MQRQHEKNKRFKETKSSQTAKDQLTGIINTKGLGKCILDFLVPIDWARLEQVNCTIQARVKNQAEWELRLAQFFSLLYPKECLHLPKCTFLPSLTLEKSARQFIGSMMQLWQEDVEETRAEEEAENQGKVEYSDDWVCITPQIRLHLDPHHECCVDADAECLCVFFGANHDLF